MAKRFAFRGIIKDIAIIAVGCIVIWLSLQAVFGTQNPFYVVASNSMVPELSVYDVLVVQGHSPFEGVAIGDIIVFDRPSDHNRVIVHRVVSIMDDDPRTLRTKGDANSASIPGTDYPITEREYIGTVTYVIPQIGYVTQVLKPPINYIIIAIVIGVMVSKHILKKRKEDAALANPLDPKSGDDLERSTDLPELSGVDKMEKDSEYSKHTDVQDKPENSAKPDSTKPDSTEEKDRD